MSENSTRDQILDNALSLFAAQGYKAVTVAQIAQKVGIRPPSLYKHFKNKQEIFTAIFSELSRRYDEQVSQLHLNGTNALQDREKFADMKANDLVHTARMLFRYFLHDNYAVRFRKMLTIGQFSNKELAAQYIRQYIDDSLSYQTVLFSFFSDKGLLIPGADPYITSLQFYAPIFLLLTLCTAIPSREQESDMLLERHIRGNSPTFI